MPVLTSESQLLVRHALSDAVAMASVNNDLLGMDPAVSAPTVGTPAADVPGVATPVEPDTVVASGGTKKNQYMVPIIAGIIFTIVFGFIVATFAGMMTSKTINPLCHILPSDI